MVARERARRLPPQERREALINATLPLVLWHGPGVTTRQIAEAADVAEGTIFRVFADKEALIRAVVERAMDPSGTLRDLDGIDRGLPLRAKLETAVTIMQSRLQGVFALIDALGWQGPPGGRDGRHPDDRHPGCDRAAHVRRQVHDERPVDDRHRHQQMNDQFREALVDVIADDRVLLRVPASELAAALRLLVFSATHPRISDGNPLTPRQIVGIVLDGLLHHSGGTTPC
jgi:AcrR family transcriptional regulator